MTASPGESHHTPRPDQGGPSTRAVHAGEARQKPTDSITDPIVCASSFTFADTAELLRFVDDPTWRDEYGRYGNPSTSVVERKLAARDGAARANPMPARIHSVGIAPSPKVDAPAGRALPFLVGKPSSPASLPFFAAPCLETELSGPRECGGRICREPRPTSHETLDTIT